MKLNPRLVMILAAASLVAHTEEPSKPMNQETLWVIPHTHWEGAVFKTREEYLQMGLQNILKALHLLQTQPSYRFTLDQVAYVKPFLERYPEQEAAFKKFVKEGRLQLVCGMNVMPDDNMPSGETTIRQMLYGKRYYRDKLGADVTVGWFLDTFGHHAQMPQLLAQSGFKSFWFFRGVPRQDFPSEFFWEGLDGTRIRAYWLPHAYGLFYGSPRIQKQFAQFARERFDSLAPNSRSRDRVALAGVDVSAPEEHLAPMVEQYSKQPNKDLRLRLAVPTEYEAVAEKQKDWPGFKGEMNPIFQGIYSSRVELKQWMREMEQRLSAAEKLSAISQVLGAPSQQRFGDASTKLDAQKFTDAWDLVTFNHAHDLASGVMTDHVYEDTVRTYEFAKRLSDQMQEAAWERLAANIDTRGDGIPLVVFNQLGWTRTGLVETTLSFSDGLGRSIALIAPDGKSVPLQILDANRYKNASLREVRIAFVARDVPAMGYAVYHATVNADSDASQLTMNADGSQLENEFYRVTLDPAQGAITSLRVKDGDWEAVSGRANVIAREDDKGDLWQLYHGLDGGSRIAETKKQPVPQRGNAKFSDEFTGAVGKLRAGPVVQEFRVVHPFDSGQFATTVRLIEGVRRVEIATELVNQQKQVRYQALFPTTILDGRNVHEIPFGASERSVGVEFPAQNWVDYSNRERGLTLLNIGLVGNVTTDGTLMLSLLRSHDLGAYGFGGGYEPGMTSNTGFELGQRRTLRYALLPHTGNWSDAGVFRDGWEFNQPLLCRKTTAHAGALPTRWGLAEIAPANVVLSALKPGTDGAIIVRVYEAAGKPTTNASIHFGAKIRSAHECNLIEDLGKSVKPRGDTIEFSLRPFEIKTFRILLEPLLSSRSRKP